MSAEPVVYPTGQQGNIGLYTTMPTHVATSPRTERGKQSCTGKCCKVTLWVIGSIAALGFIAGGVIFFVDLSRQEKTRWSSSPLSRSFPRSSLDAASSSSSSNTARAGVGSGVPPIMRGGGGANAIANYEDHGRGETTSTVGPTTSGDEQPPNNSSPSPTNNQDDVPPPTAGTRSGAGTRSASTSCSSGSRQPPVSASSREDELEDEEQQAEQKEEELEEAQQAEELQRQEQQERAREEEEEKRYRQLEHQMYKRRHEEIRARRREEQRVIEESRRVPDLLPLHVRKQLAEFDLYRKAAEDVAEALQCAYNFGKTLSEQYGGESPANDYHRELWEAEAHKMWTKEQQIKKERERRRNRQV
ncbi:unnamed protein product [Amoebophrya sp. A25]|nr:unnamed protein product [Amoebophrya sp. A25]|eukprot:GSA25T00021126001.1